MRFAWVCCVCLCLLAFGCKDGGHREAAGGTGGSDARMDGGIDGGSGGESGAGGASGSGGIGGGVGTECDPGMERDCYTGPPGTVNVGACMSGLETCNAEGTDWGACLGEVVPDMEVPTEPDQMPVDEDCDGMTDET